MPLLVAGDLAEHRVAEFEQRRERNALMQIIQYRREIARHTAVQRIVIDGLVMRLIRHIHGQPAKFRQVETDQSITEGQGRLLEYEADNGILRLSDKASLSQSGKQIQGNILTYSINEERVIASSSDATG